MQLSEASTSDSNRRTPRSRRKGRLHRHVDRILRWSGKLIFGPDMSLRWLSGVTILLLSLVSAEILYATLQGRYQARLLDRAASADFIIEACRRLPSVDTEACGAGKNREDALIWSILLESGIINKSEYDTPAALSVGVASEPALRLTRDILRDRLPKSGTGIGLLIEISRGLCAAETEGLDQDRPYELAVAYYIAGLYPADASTVVLDIGQVATKDGAALPWLALSRFRVTAPRSLSDFQIAEAMLRPVIAGTSECSLVGLGDPATDQMALLNIERLLVWGIGQIRTTADYRRAAYTLTLFTGPEQYFIFFVGIFAAVLSILRMAAAVSMKHISDMMIERDVNFIASSDQGILELLSRAGQQARTMSPSGRGYWKDQLMDQALSARWPMRLAITTLPAIGFIGTVRGIMKSLTGADSIVWATTSSERAQAINALSADLGLAFATTMLALIFGIALSFLSAIEIRMFERAILPLFGAQAFRDEPSPDEGRPEAGEGK